VSRFNYLKYAKRVLWKRGASPLYFVLFVTKNCNARCGHCLLGDHIRHAGELTFDELEKVSASMEDILFFTPTGGEPWLRADLPEIVKVFHRNNHVLNCGIPTNGSMPGRVVEGAREILDSCPGIDLHIDVSIDGIGEEHDQFRGFPGLFDRAITTYKALQELRKHYPNFDVAVQIAVSGYNDEKLPDIYDYLINEAGVSTVFTLLIRGAPKDPGATWSAPIDPAAANFKIENYENFHRVLEKDNLSRELPGYTKMPFADFINAKRLIRPKLIAKMVRERQFLLPCYAGSLGGAMYSNGDVLACELLTERVLGNVRDFDYDFEKIWQSEKAQETRTWIRDTKCFCTYECFLTVNILFTPSMYPLIMREWAELKWAELKHRWVSGGPTAIEAGQQSPETIPGAESVAESR